MPYQYWSYEILHQFCMDAFQKFGFTEPESSIIQEAKNLGISFGV